ncbi:MAG: bifunctional glycosyltransferase family 2/GtrA family protein [Clostridiaceae bacterium]|nr:bifunctional glycosyltransferase family 2/GtrA family protein [Clostridiaceae bacterium]
MSENAEQYKCAVVIPALNPAPELVTYVRELLSRGIPAVIVVDDGSRADCRPIFDEAESIPGVSLCRHTVNRGKGCALKTAYQYILDEPKLAWAAGVVTADADGQHHVDDVLNVACMTQETKGKIVLGTRNLRLSNVPPRSKLGNRLTSFAFHLLYGARLEDTQTGLRGFPRDLLSWCTTVNGDRFEYEMNVLIRAVGDGIQFCETRIQTIYYDNNAGSHLRAGRDSWRVFVILLSGLGMYTVAAAISAAIDVVMFWVSYRFLFSHLATATCYLASTVLARVLSSIVNFSLNRRYVFKSLRGKFDSAVRYYSLWLTQMMTSYLGLLGLQAILPIPAVISKAGVDIVLAVTSYQIQMRWVFNCSKT